MVVTRRTACASIASVLLVACSEATLASRGAFAAAPSPASKAIYVADFELDATEVKSESGPLNLPRPRLLREGPLGLRDPQAQARRLVELMSNSVVQDLEQAGFAARRLPPGASPAEGWLVRGVFLQVDEGNRLRRAIVGFGAGQTHMEVAASVDDLSKGAIAPLYEIDTTAHSRDLPGAAILKLNPVVAGVRFVMAGQDPERDVRSTASKIAEEVEKRIR